MSAALDLRTQYRIARRNLNRGLAKANAVEPLPVPQPIVRDIKDFLWVASSSTETFLNKAKPTYIIVREVLFAVAEKHGVTPEDICSARRNLVVVLARHEVCYRLRKETPWSLPRIGQYLGGKDHATVINGIRKHAERNGLPL
jgi:glycerol-3-phosphate dehydrogenase